MSATSSCWSVMGFLSFFSCLHQAHSPVLSGCPWSFSTASFFLFQGCCLVRASRNDPANAHGCRISPFVKISLNLSLPSYFIWERLLSEACFCCSRYRGIASNDKWGELPILGKAILYWESRELSPAVRQGRNSSQATLVPEVFSEGMRDTSSPMRDFSPENTQFTPLCMGDQSRILAAVYLIHHQGIICGVAFVRSSLRRMVQYASLVAPRRLASDAFLVIRNPPKSSSLLRLRK
jgi:hypothetical protein